MGKQQNTLTLKMEDKKKEPKITTCVLDITVMDVKSHNRKVTVDNIINDTDNPLMDGTLVITKARYGPSKPLIIK